MDVSCIVGFRTWRRSRRSRIRSSTFGNSALMTRSRRFTCYGRMWDILKDSGTIWRLMFQRSLIFFMNSGSKDNLNYEFANPKLLNIVLVKLP